MALVYAIHVVSTFYTIDGVISSEKENLTKNNKNKSYKMFTFSRSISFSFCRFAPFEYQHTCKVVTNPNSIVIML